MRRHRENLVPILAISARPADLLERLPSVYQMRQLVTLDHTPGMLWDQWRLDWDQVLWQELDGLLTVARTERLPVVLDSRGMSVSLLARVLVRLDQVAVAEPQLPAPGVVGVVGGLAAQRVLALSPYVQGLASVAALWQCRRVQQVAHAAWRVPRTRSTAPSGASPRALLPLPHGFLHVFAALSGAADIEQVSERTTYSRPRVYEVLTTARRVLGLSGERSRPYDLDQLAHELTCALGRADSEHPSQPSRPSPQMLPNAALPQRIHEVRL